MIGERSRMSVTLGWANQRPDLKVNEAPADSTTCWLTEMISEKIVVACESDCLIDKQPIVDYVIYAKEVQNLKVLVASRFCHGEIFSKL